jgi:hypothetical protein
MPDSGIQADSYGASQVTCRPRPGGAGQAGRRELRRRAPLRFARLLLAPLDNPYFRGPAAPAKPDAAD